MVPFETSGPKLNLYKNKTKHTHTHTLTRIAGRKGNYPYEKTLLEFNWSVQLTIN
jgi:hypothetical protein